MAGFLILLTLFTLMLAAFKLASIPYRKWWQNDRRKQIEHQIRMGKFDGQLTRDAYLKVRDE